LLPEVACEVDVVVGVRVVSETLSNATSSSLVSGEIEEEEEVVVVVVAAAVT
jgi:hypothetical protein